MQSTPLVAALAMASTDLPDRASANLAAAFAGVPDPRRAASVTYPLAAVLALAVAALLANHRSVLAIAEWGARQERALLAALGFPTTRTPCQSTLHRLFRQLDGDALAATLAAHIAPLAVPTVPVAGAQGVAIDGKAQRGRLRFDRPGCPVHALSAFGHEDGLVLAHEPITPGADKAEAELTVAPAVLDRIEWPGRVLTGDALFCQRALCRRVRAAGGDYLLLVKENQPALHRDIALLFDPPADIADPARLLALRRGHWGIENRLHRHKDVAFGEDASLVHLGQGPIVMALLRDAAITLLHRAGVRQVAARLRTYSQHPAQAVALVVGALPAHA